MAVLFEQILVLPSRDYTTTYPEKSCSLSFGYCNVDIIDSHA